MEGKKVLWRKVSNMSSKTNQNINILKIHFKNVFYSTQKEKQFSSGKGLFPVQLNYTFSLNIDQNE